MSAGTALPRTQPASHFTALGTYVHVGTGDGHRLPAAERLVRGVLAEVDRTCSRFRADSDLSRASARAGRRTTVDPLLVAAVDAAVLVARQTDGLVDPLLGRALVALGYDRDFAALRPRSRTTLPVEPGAWRRLRTGQDWVLVPPGTALDLGSTGKAWAADVAAATVHAELGIDVLVDVGGDISVVGDTRWPVEVRERPDDAAPGDLVWVGAGGLATSSTQVRRWRQHGVERHHLLDPRTGLPVAGRWRTVTATGPSCVAANAAATAAIVLGDEAVGWLESHRVDARLVAGDGAVRTTGGWPRPQGAA